jgi:hypothetical protein
MVSGAISAWRGGYCAIMGVVDFSLIPLRHSSKPLAPEQPKTAASASQKVASPGELLL